MLGRSLSHVGCGGLPTRALAQTLWKILVPLGQERSCSCCAVISNARGLGLLQTEGLTSLQGSGEERLRRAPWRGFCSAAPSEHARREHVVPRVLDARFCLGGSPSAFTALQGPAPRGNLDSCLEVKAPLDIAVLLLLLFSSLTRRKHYGRLLPLRPWLRAWHPRTVRDRTAFQLC